MEQISILKYCFCNKLMKLVLRILFYVLVYVIYGAHFCNLMKMVEESFYIQFYFVLVLVELPFLVFCSQ